MKNYEVAIVLHPDLEIDLEAPLARMDETLSGVGAEIKKRDEWGKRKLAYPIKGQTFGIYAFYVVEMDPSRVSELEQALRLNGEVMRHLVIALTPEQMNEESRDSSETKDTEKEDKEDTGKTTEIKETKDTKNTSKES